MKKLYLLTTKGLGDFYVIAENPTQAEENLIKIFDDQDYGFSKDRVVTNISFIAKAFKPDYRNAEKPFLFDGSTLLIVDDWIPK
jgi:hypothetical protein